MKQDNSLPKPDFIEKKKEKILVPPGAPKKNRKRKITD
jgi:hypothetical protein